MINIIFTKYKMYESYEYAVNIIINNKKKQSNNIIKDWYFEHFKRMLISFIAAVTAFTSIQNIFRDNTMNFLMPTVIGTVLIIIVTKTYKKKLLK